MVETSDVRSRDQVSVSRPSRPHFHGLGLGLVGPGLGLVGSGLGLGLGLVGPGLDLLETETEISSKQCNSKKRRPTRHRLRASKPQQGCCRRKFLIFNPYHNC